MSKFKIAHIRQQGVDLIIVPLEAEFGNKSSSDQQDIIRELQRGASSAGLAGTVVPVWRSGSQHSFIAPQNWQPFFKTFSWNQIIANLNKELTIN